MNIKYLILPLTLTQLTLTWGWFQTETPHECTVRKCRQQSDNLKSMLHRTGFATNNNLVSQAAMELQRCVRSCGGPQII
jgi:hypothetical protein